MLHPEEQQLYLESYFLVVFLTTKKSYQGNLGVITNFIFMQPDPLLHLNGNKSIKNPEPKLYFKWSGFSQMLLCEFLTFVICFLLHRAIPRWTFCLHYCRWPWLISWICLYGKQVRLWLFKTYILVLSSAETSVALNAAVIPFSTFRRWTAHSNLLLCQSMTVPVPSLVSDVICWHSRDILSPCVWIQIQGNFKGVVVTFGLEYFFTFIYIHIYALDYML